MISFIFYVILTAVVMIAVAMVALTPYYVVKEMVRQIMYKVYHLECYTKKELQQRKLAPIMDEDVAKVYKELVDEVNEESDLEVKEEYRIYIKSR